LIAHKSSPPKADEDEFEEASFFSRPH